MRGRRERGGGGGGARCGSCCVPGGGWSLRAPAASEGAAEWRAAMRDRRERGRARVSFMAVARRAWLSCDGCRGRRVGVSCAATGERLR